MKLSVQTAIASFGAKAKAKLASPTATGAPEDQLRAPFETLLADLAELSNIPRSKVTAVGESSLSDLKTRPDYAVTVHHALVGFVELKAPGKGADPRKFKDPHDKAQWEKLRSLPNLLYTDGNAFSLWQNGELVDSIITLLGDIESSGNKLQASPGLQTLFENFLRWHPIPPLALSASDGERMAAGRVRCFNLALARLCRLLRDEVTEQLALGSPALTALCHRLAEAPFPRRHRRALRRWLRASRDVRNVDDPRQENQPRPRSAPRRHPSARSCEQTIRLRSGLVSANSKQESNATKRADDPQDHSLPKSEHSEKSSGFDCEKAW